MSSWINRFSLQGRRALITGASKGIGSEICTVFADAGADIIAVGRDQQGLDQIAKEVTSLGRDCVTSVCDLEDPDAIDGMMEKLLTDGTIDILVNNAGIALVAPALDVSMSDWDRVMAVNVRAPFQLAQHVAPGMIQAGRGKIINISSQAAVIALDDHSAYSASKAAMNAMTRALMCEWARHGIQINAICPTIIMTAMGRKVWGADEKSRPMLERTPARRFGEPVEVADMALYLASSASNLVNGETLMIEGGFSAV